MFQEINHIKKNKGFTLVEVLVALFILFTVVSATTSLVNSALGTIQNSKAKFVASGLVQEGIEIVRNIRDSNWLKYDQGVLWNEGLTNGDWEADYLSEELTSYFGAGRFLKIDSNGFYNYTNGTYTKFNRKITIQNISATQTRVIVIVSWQEKSKDYSLTAVEDLYNWYAP
jgi:prepilin-type N-terminal cleavage/methylation domain-containing protein